MSQNAMTVSMPYVDGALFMKALIDTADSTKVYYGYAKPGTLVTDAKWMITQIATVSNVQTKAFAGGTLKYDKVWNSRGSYIYS